MSSKRRPLRPFTQEWLLEGPGRGMAGRSPALPALHSHAPPLPSWLLGLLFIDSSSIGRGPGRAGPSSWGPSLSLVTGLAAYSRAPSWAGDCPSSLGRHQTPPSPLELCPGRQAGRPPGQAMQPDAASHSQAARCPRGGGLCLVRRSSAGPSHARALMVPSLLQIWGPRNLFLVDSGASVALPLWVLPLNFKMWPSSRRGGDRGPCGVLTPTAHPRPAVLPPSVQPPARHRELLGCWAAPWGLALFQTQPNGSSGARSLLCARALLSGPWASGG